jgi:hypothetical protein
MLTCASFAVHDVAVGPPQSRLLPSDLSAAVSKLGTPIAIYQPDSDVPIVEFVYQHSIFVSAVYDAFYHHYPLKLNPNVVWLTIVQGFASYVNRNVEALRDQFVSHQDKEKITIFRPDFRYGSPTNDWPSVFPQFAAEIEAKTKAGIRELLESNFSNTTATDRVCSHIALMDVCQGYFDYGIRGGCGIPRIDLLGSVEDWRLVRRKAEALSQFDRQGKSHLSAWLSALLPALAHFVAAAEGSPDVAFWGSVCNLCGLSGMTGSPVTGWVSVLFPYFQDGHGGLRENNDLNLWARCFAIAKQKGAKNALADALSAMSRSPHCLPNVQIEYGVNIEDFPPGLASAPVKMMWEDVGKFQDLTFYGGIFALHQHPDGALEPRTGWAVVDSSAVKREERRGRFCR